MRFCTCEMTQKWPHWKQYVWANALCVKDKFRAILCRIANMGNHLNGQIYHCCLITEGDLIPATLNYYFISQGDSIVKRRFCTALNLNMHVCVCVCVSCGSGASYATSLKMQLLHPWQYFVVVLCKPLNAMTQIHTRAGSWGRCKHNEPDHDILQCVDDEIM